MDRAHPVSESELEIMRVLWAQEGPMMFAPLMDALAAQGKSWKANTVLTFLTRLSEKGMICITKNGRLNLYTPLLGEAEYMGSLAQSFVNDVYGGDAKGLVAALMRQDRLSRKDIEELRAYWEEAKPDA